MRQARQWGRSAPAVGGLLLLLTAGIGLHAVPASAAPGAVLLHHTTHRQQHTLSCEVAALVSALSARGIDVAEAMLLRTLPRDPHSMRLAGGPFSDYVGGPDPYAAFAGDIDGREYLGTGYGVYYPPVAAVARLAGAIVTGGEGIAPAALYDALLDHRPSVVWAQKPLRPVAPTKHYTADDGRVVPYAYPEHAYALVGVDLTARTVVLMNPFDGVDQVATMADFEASYAVFDEMAVIVGGGRDAVTVGYPTPSPAAPMPPAAEPPAASPVTGAASDPGNGRASQPPQAPATTAPGQPVAAIVGPTSATGSAATSVATSPGAAGALGLLALAGFALLAGMGGLLRHRRLRQRT